MDELFAYLVVFAFLAISIFAFTCAFHPITFTKKRMFILLAILCFALAGNLLADDMTDKEYDLFLYQFELIYDDENASSNPSEIVAPSNYPNPLLYRGQKTYPDTLKYIHFKEAEIL